MRFSPIVLLLFAMMGFDSVAQTVKPPVSASKPVESQEKAIAAIKKQEPFRLSIVPEKRSAESSSISWGNDSKHNFFVVLTNISGKPQPVFDTWNSWGYQAISFEIQLPDGKKAKMTVKPQTFTRNVATTYLIATGGHQVFPITLDNKWGGRPEFGKVGQTKVKLKAIYQVSPTPKAKDKGVWVGKVESEEAEVNIRWVPLASAI